MKDKAARRWKAVGHVAMALSLANLCFFNACFWMLYDTELGYFSEIPLQPVHLLALLCNVLGFAAVFWVAGRFLRKTRSRFAVVLACLVTLLLLTSPAEFLRIFVFSIRDRQILSFVQNPYVLVLGALMLGVVVRWPGVVARVLGVGLVLLSPLALLSLGKTTFLLLRFAALPSAPLQAEPPPPLFSKAPPTRVLWLIFDEMDYRLSFAERPPGLALPEFDRVRATSLFASNAYSPSDHTRLSVPAMLSGQMFKDEKSASASDLFLTLASTNRVVRWGEMPNIFAQARSQGCNTAVVGFYHPYTRIFGSFLNYCRWHRFPAYDPDREEGFFSSLRGQIFSMVPTLRMRSLFARAYKLMRKEALSVVADPQYGFIYVHYCVPHKPPIYNPATGRVTAIGPAGPKGYFANLQLADRTLGELRRTLEAAGQWDKTWVFITSDHCWREAALYDGKSDHRVPYLLKPPGGAATVPYGPKFNTVVSYDLVTAILRGEITTATQAAAWLKAQPPSPPPLYPLKLAGTDQAPYSE